MTKELWYHITPPEGAKWEAGWCPASTVHRPWLENGRMFTFDHEPREE
jgi:hypothetical protein